MWCILRVKEERWYCPLDISSLLGNEIINWGFALMVQYGMSGVYGYFCNLVICRVIINTFLCNLISMI